MEESNTIDAAAQPAPAPLSGAHAAALRGKAMALKPGLVIGKAGITPAVVLELNAMLARQQLLKVRLPAALDRAQRAACIAQIASECHAHLVGAVGHTASFWRPAKA
jgi:RNA-binding protein